MRFPRDRRAALGASDGQSLVEFALILPIFIVLLMGIIEFAFVFNALLGMNYASRDAALIAAEAGNSTGADCVILQTVETDVSAPSSDANIQQVQIFRADRNGKAISGASNTYVRGGSTTCTYTGGTSITVPYTLTAAGYPTSQRCNVLAGCPALGRTGLDTIGVDIQYHYAWHTPLSAVLQLLPGHGAPSGTGFPSSGYSIDKSSVMRMEPVL